MWCDVLMALQSHLIATPDLKGVPISVGSTSKVPDYKSIVLVRGLFEPKDNEPKSLNTMTVYVECWEWDEGLDPLGGYKKLSDLEGVVMPALNAFGAGSNLINGKRVQVRLGQTEPDGDAFRPSVGSRTAVTIRWK